jgi:hypothetical protein
MPPTKLNSRQAPIIIDAIYEALRPIAPQAFGPTGTPLPGTLDELEELIGPLVEIVRRTTAKRAEPYLAQILDDVCTQCPHQQPCQYCPKRGAGRCLLYRHADVVVNAIAAALRCLDDPDYWFNHPVGSIDLALQATPDQLLSPPQNREIHP